MRNFERTQSLQSIYQWTISLFLGVLIFGLNVAPVLAQNPDQREDAAQLATREGWESFPPSNKPFGESYFGDQSGPPGLLDEFEKPEAPNFQELMKPRFKLAAEWLPHDEQDFSKLGVSVTLPTYPFFGPPPPMISFGFSHSDLTIPNQPGTRSSFFEYTLSVGWVRLMAGAALATDNQNLSSDAWQFRGGAFAIYQPNDRWQWVFGAIALGRDDLPAIPAFGFNWFPAPGYKLEMIFPKPRFAWQISENGQRQNWGYTGLQFGGNTWAYQRFDRTNDRVTYRDWKVFLGWENVPSNSGKNRYGPGRRINLELGYSFARKLEFDQGLPDFSLPSSAYLGFGSSF